MSGTIADVQVKQEPMEQQVNEPVAQPMPNQATEVVVKQEPLDEDEVGTPEQQNGAIVRPMEVERAAAGALIVVKEEPMDEQEDIPVLRGQFVPPVLRNPLRQLHNAGGPSRGSDQTGREGRGAEISAQADTHGASEFVLPRAVNKEPADHEDRAPSRVVEERGAAPVAPQEPEREPQEPEDLEMEDLEEEAQPVALELSALVPDAQAPSAVVEEREAAPIHIPQDGDREMEDAQPVVLQLAAPEPVAPQPMAPHLAVQGRRGPGRPPRNQMGPRVQPVLRERLSRKSKRPDEIVVAEREQKEIERLQKKDVYELERQLATPKMSKWPCRHCGKMARSGFQCQGCDHWCHYRCDKAPYVGLQESYTCRACRQ